MASDQLDTAPRTVEYSAGQVVDCAAYVDGARLPDFADPAEVRRRGAGFVWIGLYEPDAGRIRDVAEVFGLRDAAVDDAVRAHQRPKLAEYRDLVFAVVKTVRSVEHASPTTANEIVESGEVMAFLGADFIVTVRRGDHSGLGELRRGWEAEPQRLRVGPSIVLHAIAGRAVDNCRAVSGAFENDLDVIQARVFAPDNAVGPEQTYLVEREILELRRAVTPLATPVRRQAEVSSRQNADMREVTAWAAIIAVPTMAVGVYGMNFDPMPELRWKYGHPDRAGGDPGRGRGPAPGLHPEQVAVTRR